MSNRAREMAMNRFSFDSLALAKACANASPDSGLEGLQESLGGVLGYRELRHVLTRDGWHRLGGVVDGEYRRVADNIVHWAERESAGDVDRLMAKYATAGFFATRLQGRTYYFVAPWPDGTGDFLQVEVEELQEVLDHPLVDLDWYPDSIAEFIDPLDLPHLAPEPIGDARYVFRRAVRLDELLHSLDATQRSSVRLQRFFTDWRGSSAAQACAFCGLHWVLAIRETNMTDGDQRWSAKPVPTLVAQPNAGRGPVGLAGAVLANWLHRVDQAAGYPFAWYFLMLATPWVPVEVGIQVYRDLESGFDYLPPRDARVIKAWAEDPYTC